MEATQPSSPDALFKFVSVRRPKAPKTKPENSPVVLSRLLFNTASDSEITAFETTNGEFLYTQLYNAYREKQYDEDLTALQATFKQLVDDFDETIFSISNQSTSYYNDWKGLDEVFDWYLRSDKTSTTSQFTAKVLEITGSSISSIASDADFKEKKLRFWDNILALVIKGVPSEHQATMLYGALLIDTIQKINASSSDSNTAAKIAALMDRPVIYSEFIGTVIGYTKKQDAEEVDNSFENSIKSTTAQRIIDLYGVLADLEDFELREAYRLAFLKDDSDYYGNNDYHGNDYYGNNDYGGNNTYGDNDGKEDDKQEFNGDFNGDFSGSLNNGSDYEINYREKGKAIENNSLSSIDSFYQSASAKTQYIMKQLGLEAKKFNISFTRKIIEQQIGRAYGSFPTKPAQSGMSILVGGHIINYDSGCYKVVTKDPCESANQVFIPTRRHTGLFQAAGYGDLLVVEQNLLKYELGEIAHIENVLRGEKKTREHSRLDRTEETLTTETETTKETERETQTTERFSMEKETSNVIQTNMNLESGLTVTADYGDIKLETNLGLTLGGSTTDSTTTASSYAKDVTNRALERVIEKVRTLRTLNTIHEIKEINSHILDNTATGIAQGDHVSGIYRWVDKYYKCKIRNYGWRLMIEFIVPEPAQFYIFAKANKPATGDRKIKPIDPRTLNDPNYSVKLLSLGNTAGALDPIKALEWAKIYNVPDIKPCPDKELLISRSFNLPYNSDKGTAAAITSKNAALFAKIDKYEATQAQVRVSMSVGKKNAENIFLKIANQNFKFWVRSTSSNPQADIYPAPLSQVENLSFWGSDNLFHYELQQTRPLGQSNGNGISGDVDVSVLTSNVDADFAITVTYKLTNEAYLEWQMDTYNKIMSAYQKQLSEYEDWLTAQTYGMGVTVEGNNPGINREIEKTELKKHCLTIFTGERLEWFNSMKSQQANFGYPEIDLKTLPYQASYIQFFEQAFEWTNITYRFYPYFWGRKAGWIAKSLMQDEADPIFSKFLQAGAARVVVPVRPGYEKAIATFMKTGVIWDGKPIPTPGTELYVGLTELSREDANVGGFDYEAEEWTLKVPTNLVYLQPMNENDLPGTPGSNQGQFPMEFTP